MASTDSVIDVDLPIARPPEVVWGALTDWASAPKWFGGGVERGEGPSDGMRNLTMVALHANGKAMECSVQDYEEGVAFSLNSTARGVMVARRYTLQRAPDGNTIVGLQIRVLATGLGVLFRGGVSRQVAASDREQLDRLRAYVESGIMQHDPG
jgi:hypothetical protein